MKFSSIPGAQIPPGTWGGYAAWCDAHKLPVCHPERWPADLRRQYEAVSGEPAPTRNPYLVDTCHRLRGGLPKPTEPWRQEPGATIVEKCLNWLAREFGGKGLVAKDKVKLVKAILAK